MSDNARFMVQLSQTHWAHTAIGSSHFRTGINDQNDQLPIGLPDAQVSKRIWRNEA